MALTETTIFRQINSETPMYAASGVDYLINGLSATYANKTDVYTKNEVYTKGEVDAKVTGVYHFKGSVGTFNDLLSAVQNPAVGDTYNVSDSGKNYAWTGSATAYEQGWDALGGIFDLEDYYTCEEIDEELAKYVKKEDGKGLSTNDYTTAEKTKLGRVEEGAQVNKIEKVKVDNVALTIDSSDKSVNINLSGKADKVANATDGHFAALDDKGNLKDSGSKASDFAKATALTSHTGNTTVHITSAERTKWNNKQDAISDLETIRSGAAAGATAYQKPATGIPYADLSSGVKGSLDKADTALQAADLTGYAKKSEMSAEPGTGADADKTTITLKEGTSATVLTAHQNISGKADKTSFATLKTIKNMPVSNFNLDDLVTKFNAMAAILRDIGSALNP